MKNFENLFRAALLLVLVAALIITAWHLSWLQKQNRYDMQITNYSAVVILDRQQGAVYVSYPVARQEGQPEPIRAWQQLAPVPNTR